MEIEWQFIERMLKEALVTRNWTTWLGLIKALLTLVKIVKGLEEKVKQFEPSPAPTPHLIERPPPAFDPLEEK